MNRFTYNITLSLALSLTVFIDATCLFGQTAFREFTVSVRTNPSPGYLFIAPNSSDSFAVVDHSGKNMFKSRIGLHANVNTHAGRWLSHFVADPSAPMFLRRNTRMEIIDTLRASQPYVTDFHEGRILSDSTYVILGVDTVRTDMSKIVAGGSPTAVVWGNVIQIRTFSGKTLFTWRSLDHIPVTDVVDSIRLTGPVVDYLHINSVYPDTDGNFIVSCRHTDEVIKISSSSGAVLWRMGGSKSKKNQFTFVNDSQNGFIGFSHQHSAIRTSRNTILLFDNGNLKPEPQRSRIVEYEVNEASRTVTKVWEYTPDVFLYAPTMGSVQEMDNGNILIGFGSGSTVIVAQEITRTGQVVLELRNPGPGTFGAYRVHKDSRFLVTGVRKSITSAGAVRFDTPDSSTHLSVDLTNVEQAVSLTAERHSYAPHNVVLNGGGECGVVPMRWVFRSSNASAVTGTITFHLGNTPGVDDPSVASVYWRPEEGTGSFDRLVTTYNPVGKTVTTLNIVSGEFLVAYPYCITPVLLSPSQAAVQVPISPTLQWSQASGTGRYFVELSQNPQFTGDVLRFTTTRLDTTVGPLPWFTKHYWRVRSARTNGFGPWSPVGEFTTVLRVPSIIYPTTDADTVGVLRGEVFSWTVIPEARSYNLVVSTTGGSIVLDTTVVDNRCVAAKSLTYNTWFAWKVRSVVDTVYGEWSAAEPFITALAPPTLLSPKSHAMLNGAENIALLWSSVPGASGYRTSILDYVSSDVDTVYEIPDTVVLNAQLDPARRYRWSAQGVGVYGPGNSADTIDFSVLGSSVAVTPTPKSPVSEAGVDTTGVLFIWESEGLPVVYELDTHPSFRSPVVRSQVASDFPLRLASLLPGYVYYWRVAAQAETAISDWSDTATFTTVAFDNQGLTPIIPRSGSTAVPIQGIILFAPSTKFTRYEVLLDTTPWFSLPVQVLLTETSIASYSGLKEGTTYYYRVRGLDTLDAWTDGPIARFTTTGTVSVTSNSADNPQIHVRQLRDRLVSVSSTDEVTIREVRTYDLLGRCLSQHSFPLGTRLATLPLGTDSAPVVVVVYSSGGTMVYSLVQ